MNLKLDLLGRFTYEHPVYIIAYAANAPNSNTEIVSLSFNNLNANQYFSGVGNTVTLLAEWLLPEKTGLGETPLLLHFELKESFDFDEPVSIDLASLVTPEQADGLNLKMDYTTIPNGGGSLPVTWDPQTRQAEFTPTEAGTYALLSVPLYDQRTPNDTAQEVEEPFVWEPQVDHSQVSDFTGSISYAHPVSIPPGPNGIQPPVGWVYSSAGTNGNAGALLALPYGAGWSMTQHIDIVQSLGTCQEASPEDPNSTSDSGVACEKQVQYGQNLYYTPYTLSFHGSQYELFHSSGKGSNGDPGRYHAAGDAGLYVEYCKAREGHSVSSVCVSSDDSDSNTNNGIPDEIGHRSVGFWIVKTPSNKAYRLGYTNNSEQEIRFGHTHAELDNYAYKWRVDRIQDRFSNTVTYTYDEAFKPGLNETNKWYRVQAVQSVLTQISYGDNNTYTIDFSYGNGAVAQESIAGWNTLGTLRMVHVETRSLVSIIVREDGNDVHVYRPKYVWEQYGTNDAQTPPTPGPVSQSQSTECADHAFGSERQDVHPRNIGILVEIQDLGSALQGRTETYDVRFGYTFYLTARKRLGYRSGTTDLRYCAPIMTEMTTLYGPLNQPTAEYAVREMGLEANSYGDSSDGLYFIKYDMGEFESDGDEIKDRTYSFYNTVTSQTEHSGNTLNAPDIVTYYEYNLPQHLGQDNSFQGFADVRKCEGGSCTGNWLRKNYFDFAAYDWTASDSTLTGKLTRHVIDDSVGGRNYRLDNTYDVLSNQVSGVPTDTRHPILITQVEYDKRNGGNVDTQTQFEYDMYGNQTIIKEYGGNGSVRRTTETNYVYNANSDNTGRWLVNLPWQTTLWDNEDNPFTILSRVRSRYDGAACGDQTGYVPTNGLLTNKDVYIPGG